MKKMENKTAINDAKDKLKYKPLGKDFIMIAATGGPTATPIKRILL